MGYIFGISQQKSASAISRINETSYVPNVFIIWRALEYWVFDRCYDDIILQSKSVLQTAQHVIIQRTYSTAECGGHYSNVPLSFHIKTYL